MEENTIDRLGPSGKGLAAFCIVVASVLLPAWIAHQLAPPAQTRTIHMEAFRYGFSPYRILANRGDRLKLTFSTRDTGQSFFLQDYDLHVVITPGTDVVEVHRLSRPDEPPTQERVVELTAGLPGWSGRLVSKSQFRNHTYNGPLHGTERGDLIVSPNYLLSGGLGLLCAIPMAGLLFAGGGRHRSVREPVNLFAVFPWLKRWMKQPSFQFNLALPMLCVFYLLILAGLIGTKVSGRNAGPMVIWVLWLSALIILLVPLGGRIWCLVCPLPLLGEWMQRRRLVSLMADSGDDQPAGFGGTRRLLWPAWLSSAWPRVFFFLLLGTFSTALVALPPATSWLLIGLVILAMATALFPDQRLFCRYLCPISSFIGLYSMAGRLMMRSVSQDTCRKCDERFCLVGSAKGWGCPYGLCMGEVNRNNDCGMCTECIKTCAYDNVALYWRRSGWDRETADYGESWQAIVMFALSAVYCIINLGPWHAIRDWIDIVDKQNWWTFWLYAATVWAVCLGLLPLVLYLLTRIGIFISRSGHQGGSMFRECSAALVPLGLSCWVAFALALISSMFTFVLQSLSDPFNWGWDLLGRAGSRWHIIWSPAIPWLQVACVTAGVIYSLRTLYRCWCEQATSKRQAAFGSLPLGSFLWMAAAGMIYFYAG